MHAIGRLFLLAATLFVSFASLAALVSVSGAMTAPLGAFSLEGFACAQPCWQGIAPGVTTADEAERLLAQSRFVLAGSVARGSDGLRWLTTSGWAGRAFVEEGGQGESVTTIWLHGAFPLGDIMAELGPPERAWVRYTRDILNYEQVKAWFFYPETQVSLEGLGGRPGPPLLSPELLMRGVFYAPAPDRINTASLMYDSAALWEGFALGRYRAGRQ